MLLFYPLFIVHHACECRKKGKETSEWNIVQKSVDYRDAIKSKETWPGECGAVIQWMMAT